MHTLNVFSQRAEALRSEAARLRLRLMANEKRPLNQYLRGCFTRPFLPSDAAERDRRVRLIETTPSHNHKIREFRVPTHHPSESLGTSTTSFEFLSTIQDPKASEQPVNRAFENLDLAEFPTIETPEFWVNIINDRKTNEKDRRRCLYERRRIDDGTGVQQNRRERLHLHGTCFKGQSKYFPATLCPAL